MINIKIIKMKTTKIYTSLMILFLCSGSTFSQKASGFPELLPASNHYAELSIYAVQPDPARSWMDTIEFPSSAYNAAVLYALIKPVYLETAQIDLLKDSVEFPANSSEQTKKELDFLVNLQAERTPEQVSDVLEHAEIGYWPEIDLLPKHPDYKKNLDDLFYEVHTVLGKSYAAENSPLTARLLKKLMNDMRLMEFAVKYDKLRARPYQLDSRLEPLRRMKSPSFASGHTLWAYLQAFVLAELIPSKKEEFYQLAYEIGLSREIMGVHYPSDEEASRQLAHEMLNMMWKNPDFRKDFVAAREEWQPRSL